MNERALNALRSIVVNLGGTVPAPAGVHWNQYALDLIDAAVTAAGGTPRARTGGWNEDLTGALEKLSATVTTPSSLSTMSVLTTKRLADYTQSDPNGVLLSVADSTIGGTAGYLQVGLTKSTQASGLPKGASAGVSWSRPAEQLGGTAMDSDIYDLLAAVALWSGVDAPETDVCIGACLADTIASASTVGFGVRLSYSGGLWQVAHLVCASGTWTVGASAGATSASIVGAIAQAIHTVNTTQRQVRAKGLDANGAPVTTANTASAASTANVSDNLTTLILYAGWLTGGVGTNGASCALKGHPLSTKFSQISGYAR